MILARTAAVKRTAPLDPHTKAIEEHAHARR